MAEEKNKTGPMEISDNRRKFEHEEVIYYINTPTAKDVREADWVYSKIYSKALAEGILTSAEMNGVLMQRGVIGPEFERRQTELTNILSDKIEQLENIEGVDEKQQLALEVAVARQELYNWNHRQNGPMTNTCEYMADDARVESITSSIVEYENGSRVWKKYEDYLSEKDRGLATRSRFEVMLYLQGIDSDFLDKTPEAMAFKEVAEDFDEKAAVILASLDSESSETAEELEDASKEPVTTSKRRTRKKSDSTD